MSKLFKNDFRDETTSDFSTQYNFSSGGVPSSLLITVDATHAGYINRNGFCYDSGAMSYAVSQDVWTKPFEKPLLKNHDMDVDPLGRVVASRFIKTSESEGFTQLDVKVTDKEAIQKIIDGRYLTVSTHGAPMDGAPNELKYVKCSICDQNMLTAEEWCGHMRGNIYDNEKTGNEQKCFWSIGAMDYKEVSIVNSPADYRSNEGAAQIVSYTMMDGENPVPFHEKEEAHRPALIFSDSEVAYADSSISEENFVEELIANPVLWEAVNHDKKAYIDSKGLLFVQDTEKDKEVCDENTEDDADWDAIMAEMDLYATFLEKATYLEDYEDAPAGGSNAGKYKTKGPYCGKAGGAPAKSYPVNTRARAKAALSYARHAPKPNGIRECVCRHYSSLPSCSKDNENSAQLKGEKPTNPPVQKDTDLERYLSLVIRWDELSSEDKQEILVYTQWTLEKSLNDAKDARKREQDFDSVLKSLELIQ
jgi:hypothetical protein|tara:strand:+ start:2221 stop:3651 length:1431 start_codon:yes stop_codon:yes gene_type:complete